MKVLQPLVAAATPTQTIVQSQRRRHRHHWLVASHYPPQTLHRHCPRGWRAVSVSAAPRCLPRCRWSGDQRCWQGLHHFPLAGGCDLPHASGVFLVLRGTRSWQGGDTKPMATGNRGGVHRNASEGAACLAIRWYLAPASCATVSTGLRIRCDNTRTWLAPTPVPRPGTPSSFCRSLRAKLARACTRHRVNTRARHGANA